MNSFQRTIAIVLFNVISIVPSSHATNSIIEEIFEVHGIDQNNIGNSTIWGEVDLSNDPWILTDALGWVYLYPDSSPTGYWVWVNGLGWLHSAVGKFPSAYLFGATRFEDGEILLDLLERSVFRFYHYDQRQWRESGYEIQNSDNPITLVQQKLHSGVPEEYIGLAARNPRFIDRTYAEVLVGPYYLIVMEAFVGTYTVYTYSYDSSTGMFLPSEVRTPNLDYGFSLIGLNEEQPLKLIVEGNLLILETESGIRSTFELLQ